MNSQHDMRAVIDAITKNTDRLPNRVVTSMENVELLNPELAQRLREAGPEVEVPIEKEEPVKVIELRERKPKPPAPGKMPRVFFYMTDLGVDGVMKVKTSGFTPVPSTIGHMEMPFQFPSRPNLAGGVAYTMALFENGVSRVGQGFMLERDTIIAWARVTIARPNSSWANLQLKVMSGDLILGESIRRQVGRNR